MQYRLALYIVMLHIIMLIPLPAAIALSGEQRAFLQDSVSLANTPAELRQVLELLHQNKADLMDEPALAAALQEKAAALGISWADYPAVRLPQQQSSPSPVRWPLIIGISLVLLSIVGIELYRLFHAATAPVPEELVAYLQDGVSKGYAVAELRSQLLKSGWEQDTVDAAVQHVKNTPALKGGAGS